MTRSLLLFLILITSSLFAQDSGKRPRILGVAHAAFYVSDLQRARNFYTNYLGFEEVFSFKGKDGLDRLSFIKIDDTQYIELSTETPKNDGHLSHIAFYTDDILGLYEYLKSMGMSLSTTITKGRSGNSSFAIVDPDGHNVEIVQYEDDSRTSQEKGNHMPVTRTGTHIEHVGIATRSIEQAMSFYCDTLGFERNGDKVRVAGGEDRVEFGLYRKPPTPEFLGSRNHICLRVPDVQKAVTALTSRDSSIAIETHLLQRRNLRANIKDPDGTRIELMDR
jgi:catechol 2,3-dioxygenase-like lactoylglutathione lyase family enzyme